MTIFPKTNSVAGSKNRQGMAAMRWPDVPIRAVLRELTDYQGDLLK